MSFTTTPHTEDKATRIDSTMDKHQQLEQTEDLGDKGHVEHLEKTQTADVENPLGEETEKVCSS